MDRREFLKKTIAAGVAAGAASVLGKFGLLFGEDQAAEKNPMYDLVAVKGSTPEKMFAEAVKQMGGPERFVRKGQTVLVKPNIGWEVSPEGAANTNPLLVGAIVKLCLDAGAKKVHVFDHTCDNGPRSYKKSGIEDAVKQAGGQMVPANGPGYFQEVKVPGGESLRSAMVHELLISSDVFINVPVLKSHGSARLTIGMKNLMGVVQDRGYWHANDLHQCIADFAAYRKPDLTVVDAYRVMVRNGPRGYSPDDTVLMKSMVVSTDPVAADAAGVKLFGLEPDAIRYIRIAHEKKIGTKDLDSLRIKRIVL